MTVHEYIRNFANDSDVRLTSQDVARLASVLKTAGFRGTLSKLDQQKANPILASRIGKIVGAEPSKVRTADTEVASIKDEKSFKKIDALVKQGKCARCGKPTDKVRLADYDEVMFCPECRTVLW